MEKITHIDLFAGIAGFSLASEAVFGDVEHVFVEIDPFCQQVLKKHFPTSYIHDDIRTFTNASCQRRQQESRSAPGHESENERRSQKNNHVVVSEDQGHFLLTGGFPCQPFSQAGRRRGTADDRFLWPEMLRVIRAFRPTWVIAENVRGLLTQGGGVVFEQVCADLEGEGYDVQPLVIPAVAVNAPHRRDRVWFIAHAKSERTRGESAEVHGTDGGQDSECIRNSEQSDKSDAPDAQGANWVGLSERAEETHTEPRYEDSDASDTTCEHLERRDGESGRCKRQTSWNQDWTSVATRLCTLDDGLPGELVRPRGWRNAALKAAGNAIVPQVAIEIMKAIKHASLHTKEE